MIREDLDNQLLKKGISQAAVQKARFHALEQGYVAIALTKKGREKLKMANTPASDR